MRFLYVAACLVFLSSCSMQQKIHRSATKILFADTALAHAHTGIVIYDATSKKILYDHQGQKYFVPASNTKIFTTYAGLKYLGDSLPGIQFFESGDSLYLVPTGDPTFLHKDFPRQPVLTFLRNAKKQMSFTVRNWRDSHFGFGWTWDDYNSSYMAERSPFPIYGNTIRFVQMQQTGEDQETKEPIVFTEPDINWKLNFNPDSSRSFAVRRQPSENIFRVTNSTENYREIEVPFITNGIRSAIELMKDTVQREITTADEEPASASRPVAYPATLKTIHSQRTDSFLRIMMHRSDNFFAEQTLMMVSQLKFGFMDDGRLINDILTNDLKDLPQQPRWVDGSGLSRYNMFTPRDFVWILDRMKTEFTLDRLKNIFPTGGQGTLRNFYVSDSTFLYAKTGTLSGHVALSGYYLTKNNRILIFSILVNNHQGSAPAIRRKVEAFLRNLNK